ncbi:MAG: glycoside hydrolase family 97 protein [Prevotella sp.]
MGRRLLATFITLACAVAVENTAAAQVVSPNGKVEWREKGKGFAIVHHNNGNEQEVLEIANVGMLMKDGGGKKLTLKAKMPVEAIKDSYTMIGGKRYECSNEANEVTYTYIDDLGRQQLLKVRAYNDGVAFRYMLDGLQHTRATEELTTFRIPESTKRWIQKWTEPYEDFFPLSTTGENENKRWGYPALIQSADNVFALITEAGIHRYNSASSLYNDRNKEEYRVVMDENQQNTTGKWLSPWRVVIVGELKDVVASTLVTDVSESCRIEDTSWIKPGSVSWIYWAYNHGSNDYQIVKKYVDMAVEMHWPYVLIDAEWDEMKNGGNIEDAIRYTLDKGIKPILWYNSSTAWIKAWGAPGPHERLNAPENREREFAWLEKMGVAGVKIDFFAGDKQETMEYCIDLLECAARHHLMVNFHGATIPRGWQRTYPNLVSVEAVYGAEWYNNNATLTPKAAAHNATLPFTRNVIGPMDYTPCTFSDSQHKHITTHAHELALPVLFESPMLHWADKPESYLVQPKEVKDFMSALPTTWDEIRLLGGYPGEWVVIARRCGKTWYVAGINGKDDPQTLTFDTSFLPKGKYTLFTDKPGYKGELPANNPAPWSIKKGKGKVPAKLTCLPRGGFVIVVN